MRTQVVIVGGGPAGLLLGEHLTQAGIENVILERQSQEHVTGRIRAGVLEVGLTNQLRFLGLGARMDAEGYVHDGTVISFNDTEIRIDFAEHTDTTVMVYGQTEVTKDLYAARSAASYFCVESVEICDVEGAAPFVTFRVNGEDRRIDCDFVAGCDGFHGVSRQTIPVSKRREYEKVYPFGWLGVLSRTRPVHEELIYANSDHGFALCSMRNEELSRYYVQCRADDDAAAWSDDAFWSELRKRIPGHFAEALETGPTVEKSIAQLRSFVCEPMSWGRLFLCGDAAHIVPPTGAKGLNTAASDVYYLAEGLKQYYLDKDSSGLDGYSERALARVWKAERFSWWMTQLLHHFPDQSGFDRRMQEAEVAFLEESGEAQAVLARNYVGLPY
ncbi:MAG: 4-hydroxybenzoate 3-monooxygenase [Pseudomonadota bacterium]